MVGGFRVRAIALVLGLAGAAFLVVALFLWAVSQLPTLSSGLVPLGSALVVVPGVIGTIACVAAFLLLALSRGRRSVSAGIAGAAPSSAPVSSSVASSTGTAESVAS